jgi:RND family efflux transporter MFP subunit
MANEGSDNAARAPGRARRRGGGLALNLIGLVLVLGAAAGGLLLWQSKASSRAAAVRIEAQAARLGPRVEIVPVAAGASTRDVRLLGDVHPFATVTLYGKVSGYLTSITVDKGDTVKAGQIIAVIASDETDRQYDSALADLANKRRLAARSHALEAQQFASREAMQTADTNLRMAEETVSEDATLRSYETLRAPFAGTVTARFVDPGALIQNSETNQTSNQPIVTIADARRLRVYVHVDQRDAPFLHVGDAALIADAANPARRIAARVARTSGALDPATRTLLVEMDLDNASGFLLPGSFVDVTLKLPTEAYPQVPAGALVLRGARPYLAAIGADDRVHFEPIRIASTDGSTVDIAEGAKVGERVALNLPSTLAEGAKLQPVAARSRGE